MASDAKDLEGRFLAAILSGERRAACGLLNAYYSANGLGAAFEDIVCPALREVGALWQQNSITVADEHVATAVAQLAIAALYPALRPPRAVAAATAVVACCPGEEHGVGARMIADLLDLDGWRVLYLGGNTPGAVLLEACARARPALVALSVAMPSHAKMARATIAELRGAVPSARIVVGGRLFYRSPQRSAGAPPEEQEPGLVPLAPGDVLGADFAAHTAREGVSMVAPLKALLASRTIREAASPNDQ